MSVDDTFKSHHSCSNLDFFLLSDDTRAVYPRSAAQRAPPAGGVGVRDPGLPGSGDLWVEEEMPVLLHPPPPRHHDSQLGSYNLDPQSHELHSGKRREAVHRVVYFSGSCEKSKLLFTLCYDC